MSDNQETSGESNEGFERTKILANYEGGEFSRAETLEKLRATGLSEEEAEEAICSIEDEWENDDPDDPDEDDIDDNIDDE